jgi:hypothetical protein
MRTLSLAQASVYATGAFVGVLALFAGAAVLALGGPLTKYETSDLGEGVNGAMQGAKGAIHRLRSGICRRLPVAFRDMTPCPSAKLASANPHSGPLSGAHARGGSVHQARAHGSPPSHHALRRRTAHKPHRRG